MPAARVRPILAALAVCALVGVGVGVGLGIGVGAAAGDRFLAGFGDLPLMKGLAAVPDSETVFDTPDGRIVEAYAAGAVSRGSAEAFYRKSLPQLGWRRVKPNVYRREEETLTIEFRQRGGTLTVRFMLAPAGAGR